jgi:phosphonopyruvate decarboxylase
MSKSKLFGVPDSLLKDCVSSIEAARQNTVEWVANEGVAVARGIGAYLATGVPSVVVMQNSGIGNAYNPLVSLCAKEVYRIPIVLIIGWRAEINADGSQLADEPQHKLQGQITTPTLKLLGAAITVVDDWHFNGLDILDKAIEVSQTTRRIQAIVVRKQAKRKSQIASPIKKNAKLYAKSDFLLEYRKLINCHDIFTVATTGYTSREYYKIATRDNIIFEDFLTVGGMGHAVSIARGYIGSKKGQKVVCLDGDGAEIMHLGAFADIEKYDALCVICFRNYVHESVGGQKVAGDKIKLSDLMKTLGFANIFSAKTPEGFSQIFKRFINEINPTSTYIECEVEVGVTDKLPRPRFSLETQVERIIKNACG